MKRYCLILAVFLLGTVSPAFGDDCISGKVYYDIDGNGFLGSTDVPLAGATVDVRNSTSILETTTSDSEGNYTLCTSYIEDSSYYVLVTMNGYTISVSYPTVLFEGESVTDVNLLMKESFCCYSFSPEKGKRYWLSAWVQEEHPAQVKSYTDSRIEIEFTGSSADTVSLVPSGEIIDGWQRIVGSFTMPETVTGIKIHLVSTDTEVSAYFDDIRIHPFNASMKSYVYDPVTNMLSAELDDNNYATFYEYDNEGQLIRIKKETARGIMTIQETRSSNPKK